MDLITKLHRSAEPLSLEKIKSQLRLLKRPIVALSGGLDSSVLAYLVREVKGREMLTVSSNTWSLSSRERDDLEEFVKVYDIPHVYTKTREFEDEKYLANDKDRCYFCKFHLFDRLSELAVESNYQEILFGAQADDVGDYRPGHRAADEFKVMAPLLDAHWGKTQIRKFAESIDLKIAGKPASPCLASRLAYGVRVTPDRLQRIERAETIVTERKVKVCRVRDLDNHASIEIGSGETISESERVLVINEIKELGFDSVVFDDRGYRQGSLNDALSKSI
ncbi:MAG: ATP-dependent sacrificial sulfur transferase LarE [Candidatus Lindowbacteria bacterium]|nr:ATP-dependent sacrificial sulfur transferase LarE [Candidatus Lindowbacteria bacterium]